MPTPEELAIIKGKHQKSIMKKKNVTGLGIGYKETQGKKTDELCVVVLVEKKEDISALSKKDIIPETVGGVKTDVKHRYSHVASHK